MTYMFYLFKLTEKIMHVNRTRFILLQEKHGCKRLHKTIFNIDFIELQIIYHYYYFIEQIFDFVEI